MQLVDVVDSLDKDFIKDHYFDEWSNRPDHIEAALTKNFMKHQMGLMFDFSEKIQQVYTSTFASKQALKQIQGEDVLWFSHHAANWDIRKAPNVFTYLDEESLQEMRRRRISLYILHVPLDEDHMYGTSVCLGDELKLTKTDAFFNYRGALAATLNESEDLDELIQRCKDVTGHDIGVYRNGVTRGRVTVVGGGGFDKEVLTGMKEQDSNILVTGITANNKRNQELHAYCQEHQIAVIGLSHYSSEKFACMKMVEYFQGLGLPAAFLAETPVLEDM